MRLTNVRLPLAFAEGAATDLALCDIVIEAGRIATVAPSSGSPSSGSPPSDPPPSGSTVEALDCGGCIVVPAFVDMHTHLDKGHIVERTGNPDGTFSAALAATTADRTAHWTAADVHRRMEFSLRCAYAHGTVAIRTHIDSRPPQDAISWPVFAELREAWRGRIELQGSSLVGIAEIPDDPTAMFDLVTAHGGIVGAVLYPEPGMPGKLRTLLRHAEERGLDIDFHVDETLDPNVNCLGEVAAAVREIGFSGTVTCGHCCSLMTMADDDAARTLDAVAEARLAIVSLPLCNLYLQDRHAGRTPRVRGGTLVHEMAARGIEVAVASDNTRDPFYAYGDLDMVEVFRAATRVLQLDHPVGDWPRAFSATPASIMVLPDRDRIAPGAPADLVVFRAKAWSELFSRPQMDRTIIRGGKVIDATLPNYAELL